MAVSCVGRRLYLPDVLCPFLFCTSTIYGRALVSRKRTDTSGQALHASSSTAEPVKHRARRPPLTSQQANGGRARPSAASTLTREERKVFEDIRRRFGDAVEGITPSATREPVNEPASSTKASSDDKLLHDLDVDRILSLFAPDQPRSSAHGEFRLEDHEPPALGQLRERPMTPQEIRTAALTAIISISKSIRHALRSTSEPPDQALWHVLEAEVFPLADLLKHPLLDPSTLARLGGSDQKPYLLTVGEVTSKLKGVPSETPLLSLITILYPAATLLALRSFAAYQPASSYALALLPKVKSLGPTSYLLAGNTHFYSCLLQIQWEVYSDLSGISKLLREMKSNGVIVDEGTAKVFRMIVADRGTDLDNTGTDYGRSSPERGRDWWQMGIQRQGFERVVNIMQDVS